jgi:hypothetical protein
LPLPAGNNRRAHGEEQTHLECFCSFFSFSSSHCRCSTSGTLVGPCAARRDPGNRMSCSVRPAPGSASARSSRRGPPSRGS